MSGDESDSLPVWLHDRQRSCFERGQINTFVISYPRGVGDLNYVQIWHDNSGTKFRQFHDTNLEKLFFSYFYIVFSFL